MKIVLDKNEIYEAACALYERYSKNVKPWYDCGDKELKKYKKMVEVVVKVLNKD